jgi:hypothetical protein
VLRIAESYRRASYDMIWLGPPSAALLDDLIQIMGNDSSLARFSQTIKDFLVERYWGSGNGLYKRLFEPARQAS